MRLSFEYLLLLLAGILLFLGAPGLAEWHVSYNRGIASKVPRFERLFRLGSSTRYLRFVFRTIAVSLFVIGSLGFTDLIEYL